MKRLRGAHIPAGLLVAALVLGCSSSGMDETGGAPTPVYDGSGELRTVESTTQMHLDGVAIGVGNIWEEDYTGQDGASQRGLTAGLFISVEEDETQNRFERVHPGQELSLPGYRLIIVAVDERSVTLAVVDE